MNERLKHLIKEQDKKDRQQKKFSAWDCNHFKRIGKVRACELNINKTCVNIRCLDFVVKAK